MWTRESVLSRINKKILSPLEKKGLNRGFSRRLNSEFPQLWNFYLQLYGQKFDCLYQLEELVELMALKNMDRDSSFTKRDNNRAEHNNWFSSRKSVGIMLYVDLFNLNLQGLKNKLDYFSDLGVNTLHLMPLFKSPAGESDGGYAVSDYQIVREDLGTMEELSELAETMRSKGMVLILDFVLNHTSDGHFWAVDAAEGSDEFQKYYFMFDSKSEAEAYDSHLREIFPSVRKGSFTYIETCGKWVWTTFNSYQWDLNYSNPDVFRAMCGQMLFLANHGADVLRLDALAFTWKEIGTSCENLPKAHTLIKTFRSVARIAAPGLTFLSEAIVHPDEVINYISEDECELSYNPLLMATCWEALATRDTSLLRKSFSSRFSISEDCRWVNYMRCHDDIGWTFCNDDAASLNINGFDHRKFLNEFYSGFFPGSFACGVPFQENPETGDARISGTLASLAGLELASREKNPEELDLALKRIRMLMGFNLSLPGLPLIYSGDELAILNDYSYMNNPDHCDDSRWVHRSPFPWSKLEHMPEDDPSLTIYEFIRKLIKLRKRTKSLEGHISLMNLKSTNLIGFKLTSDQEHLLVLVNFTERVTALDINTLRLYGGNYIFKDLISDRILNSDSQVEAYQILWLEGIEI